MNSVFQEIEKLRMGVPIQEMESYLNRYTIVCKETDRTKTAYCFSVPIRNAISNEVVDLSFQHRKNESIFIGSDCKISITDKARFSNQYGQCEVIFGGKLSKKTKNTICFSDPHYQTEILPTLNGLVVIMTHDFSIQPKLLLRVDPHFESTNTNRKSFSMRTNPLSTLPSSSPIIRNISI